MKDEVGSDALALAALNPLAPSGLRVVEQVYLALRDAMASGLILPGTRLLEVQVANQLGVSRTPVREALQRLEAERLAVRVRGRGLIFTEVKATDVSDLGRIRISLDTLAAEMATQRAKKEDWDIAWRHLDELEDALNSKADRQSRVRRAHRAFHQSIYQLAFSPLVSGFLENNVLQFLEISTRLHASTTPSDTSTIEDHRTLLHILTSGNHENAAIAARVHSQAGVEQVEERIMKRRIGTF